jgi:hypothetical protein
MVGLWTIDGYIPGEFQKNRPSSEAPGPPPAHLPTAGGYAI